MVSEVGRRHWRANHVSRHVFAAHLLTLLWERVRARTDKCSSHLSLDLLNLTLLKRGSRLTQKCLLFVRLARPCETAMSTGNSNATSPLHTPCIRRDRRPVNSLSLSSFLRSCKNIKICIVNTARFNSHRKMIKPTF